MNNRWRILRPALIWSASFAGLGLLLGLALIGPRNVWEIVYPHLMAPTKQSFQNAGFGINAHLQAAVPLILPGLLGAVVTVYRRNWPSLYPLAWAAVADGILSLTRAARSCRVIRLEAVWGAIALMSFLLVSFSYFPSLNKGLLNRPRFRASSLDATSGKLRVIAEMNESREQTHPIMTDLPMYAFRVHKPVPPF